MGFQEILNNFLNRSSYKPADVPGYVLDDYERSQQEITGKIAAQKKIHKAELPPALAERLAVGI